MEAKQKGTAGKRDGVCLSLAPRRRNGEREGGAPARSTENRVKELWAKINIPKAQRTTFMHETGNWPTG